VIKPMSLIVQASDRQASVMVAQTNLSVVFEGPCLVLKFQFQTYAVFSYLLHKNDMLMS